MAKLFGFSIESADNKSKTNEISPVPQNSEDGSNYYLSGGFYGQYYDIEGVYKNEFQFIKRYREMALHPEVDSAIEDIVNEAIVSDTNDTPVQIELSNLNVSDGLKKAIRKEFRYILDLLDFDKKAHEIYRNWYVDGRLYYHKVIDVKNPHEGIKELRYIDALQMQFVRKEKSKKRTSRASFQNKNNFNFAFPEIDEYFVYNPKIDMNGNYNYTGEKTGIPIAKDAITYCTSGLVDRNRKITLSYLNKAIKSLNQLRMIEDSLVIYRLSRAPERRIFYIDVGNLPKIKAEQYLRDVMMRYRNKMVYDACLSMNTKIPLLDGRILTLSEITEEYNNGNRLWTYSCDPKTGEFSPGIISWAGVTRKNEKVLKITLDNDKEIVCTLDHKFPVWNKGKVEAKDLKIGDSMIPFYTQKKKICRASNSTYSQIFENKSKKWKFVHRLVSEWKDSNNILNEYVFDDNYADQIKQTIHHIDYNRYNNTPENLIRMARDDHFKYHKKHCRYAGKIGGKVTAQRKKEKNIPYFLNYNLTKEQRMYYGKLGGLLSTKNKTGIHGLSIQEIRNNSLKGNKILNEKLNTDLKFYNSYCQSIKNSWTIERKKSASIRGKNIPNSHFIEMNSLANISRWQGKNSKETRQKLSATQTIEYTQQIYNLIEYCARKNSSVTYTITHINNNLKFDEWKKLNFNKKLRKGRCNDYPLNHFSYSNLNNACKSLGFNSFKEYRNSFIYINHKIKNIEFLEETVDVGTLTIDREELYHDYHTFALDAGVYTCNSTGEIRDDKKFFSMMEDFWLPRREGGRGTEITTLPGGQNLGEITDINYFQKKLYRSLNVPISRIDNESGFNVGRTTEIERDEVKFTKFVGRLRKRFSAMFSDMLKTQLLLKNIVSIEDWEHIRDHIQYDFLYDNHFSELKDAELLTERLNLAATAEPYIGKYFSQDYLRRKILRQTDEEIVEQDKIIKKEIEDGVIPDPNAPVDEMGNPLPPEEEMGTQDSANQGEI